MITKNRFTFKKKTKKKNDIFLQWKCYFILALAPCVQRSTESGSIYTINGNSSGLSSSLIAHFCDVFTDYLKTLNANKAVIEKKSTKLSFIDKSNKSFFVSFKENLKD